MIEKYIFDDINWIVTLGEIKITPLYGTKPMHPALSKKLYDQNIAKYSDIINSKMYFVSSVLNAFECTADQVGCNKPVAPTYNTLKENVTTINKYTIVELTYNSKHYHGLATKADCDKENVVTGVAVAYHRAFEKMMAAQDNIPHNEKYHSTIMDYMNQCRPAYIKELSEMIDNTPSDKETKAINKFNTSTYHNHLKKFTEDTPIDTINKKYELVERALLDLIACTYIDLSEYDLKTTYGVKAALKKVRGYGYKIYEVGIKDPLKSTYILKHFGKEITHRDIDL